MPARAGARPHAQWPGFAKQNLNDWVQPRLRRPVRNEIKASTIEDQEQELGDAGG